MKNAVNKVKTVFEDDHIVVSYKPSGLLSVPNRANDAPSLLGLLRKRYGAIFNVHRLDKYTSGVTIAAKTLKAQQVLTEQFKNRIVKKTYLAFLDGIPIEPVGRIEAGIAPVGSDNSVMKVDKKGKWSITEYKVIKQWDWISLVRIRLLTGRTHQIRVHFAYIGCPLVVDPIYGNRDSLFLGDFAKKKIKISKGSQLFPLVKRQTLHAETLSIIHPESGKPMRFEVPFPKDLRALDRQLDKTL